VTFTFTLLDYPCDVNMYMQSCGIPYYMNTICTACTWL